MAIAVINACIDLYYGSKCLHAMQRNKPEASFPQYQSFHVVTFPHLQGPYGSSRRPEENDHEIALETRPAHRSDTQIYQNNRRMITGAPPCNRTGTSRAANRDRYLQWMQKHGSGRPCFRVVFVRISNIFSRLLRPTSPC